MQNYEFDYNQYKMKINKKNKYSICVMSFLILILLGVAFFVYPKDHRTTEFYFVEIRSFVTYNEANNLATTIQSMGGAGYVYYDGYYHVLAAYYPNEKDAKKVCENLKSEYDSAEVYTLTTDKFLKSNSLTTQENNTITEMINTNLTLIEQLYSNIIAYDTSSINESQLLINLENLKTDYKNKYDNYLSYFKQNDKFSKSIKYLNKILNSTENFKSICSDQQISYKIKYELIKIVINHSSFLASV